MLRICDTLVPALPLVQATALLTSDNTNEVDRASITIGSHTYRFVTRIIDFGRSVLTSNNTNVSNNDTVTVGTRVYKFVTALTLDGAHAGEVVIGTDADGSLANLISAINHTGASGTDYDSATTIHASVTAGAVASHTSTVVAKVAGEAGNLIATTTTASTLSWTSTTFAWGHDDSKDDVLIGGSADATLGNLLKAVNGTGTAGTDYGTLTVKNTQVQAGAVTSHTITFTAVTGGTAANDYATTDTSDHMSWDETTMHGGSGGATTAIKLDKTGAVTSETFDMGAYNEAIAFLYIISHAGTNPTLDIKFQYSHNNVNWMDSGDAFSQVTTADTVTLKRLTANFGKYVRVVITLGGTTPQYVFDLAIVAKG